MINYLNYVAKFKLLTMAMGVTGNGRKMQHNLKYSKELILSVFPPAVVIMTFNLFFSRLLPAH